MNTIFTFGMILFSILGGVAVLWPDVTVKPLLIVPITVAVLVPPLIHPSAKTLWVGIDLMMNPVEPGEAIGATNHGKAD